MINIDGLSLYESCAKEAEKAEQKEIEKWLGECKTIVTKGCDDFHCCFAGTVLCISENCSECALNNCRGCSNLEECFNEMMEV